MDEKKPLFLPSLTPEQIQKRIRQAADFKTVYVNHTRISPSFYDIRIFMGQSSLTPTGEPTFEEELCVVMTPECVNVVMANLLQSLAVYQKVFGQIRGLPHNPPGTEGGKRKKPPVKPS